MSRLTPGPMLCMLLQWKGLPYAECTFETPEVIAQAGGQEALDQYEVTLLLTPSFAYAGFSERTHPSMQRPVEGVMLLRTICSKPNSEPLRQECKASNGYGFAQ